MPDSRTTIILFLIDNQGVPGVESENYLCSLFVTPETNSFPPARVTHDNRGLRKKILSLMTDEIPTVQRLRRDVGQRIWRHLGLASVFAHLKKTHEQVTFLTNDSFIPWEWAAEPSGKTICEMMSCGTVFFEQMELAAKALEGVRSREALHDIDEQVQRMKAILLFDAGDHHGLKPLPHAKEEAEEIRNVLVQSGLKSRNIKTIDGAKDDAEDKFVSSIHSMRNDLGIIHYSGHILDGNLRLRHDKIECKEIADNFDSTSRLLRTLVFLNGCESGEIKDVWSKEKNMSTAWLKAGAGGIICCRQEIFDDDARRFAATFYEKLLSKEGRHQSVGTALKLARQGMLENHGSNVSWLQYTLFGYPHFSLLQPPQLNDLKKPTSRYNKALKELQL